MNDFDPAALATNGCGTVTVTFIAEDECGNTANTTSSITIVDDTPPVFEPITPLVVDCAEGDIATQINTWIAAVTATDNCGEVTVTNDFDPAALATNGCGTVTVTFIAEDECGNTANTTSSITIVDDTPPVFEPITPLVVVDCAEGDIATQINTWIAAVTATDNCGEVTVTNDFDPAALATNGCGTVTVTFIAEDECGNTANTTSSITIVDDTPPVFEPITPL